MPHQCTNCGRSFADGSKEMLSGCPDCGGNKFQFQPSRSQSQSQPQPQSPVATDDRTPPEPRPDASSTGGTPPSGGDDAGTVDRARTTVRQWVSQRRKSESEQNATAGGQSSDGRTSERPPTDAESTEDRAQADARSGTVSPDELPRSGRNSHRDAPEDAQSDSSNADPPGSGEVIEAPDDTKPDLQQLREELNSQFESIKILSPGQYELNLMELYEREEYIIALREDGRYVIEVPDSWDVGN